MQKKLMLLLTIILGSFYSLAYSLEVDCGCVSAVSKTCTCSMTQLTGTLGNKPLDIPAAGTATVSVVCTKTNSPRDMSYHAFLGPNVHCKANSAGTVSCVKLDTTPGAVQFTSVTCGNMCPNRIC